jgi:SRSO17 transposase
VPVCVGLRLFLPENWCGDAERRAAVGVPEVIAYRPKWQIALEEIDRALASRARFGCVLTDAEYGKAAESRAGLDERRLAFAVGVLPTQKVYPAGVTLSRPARQATGRPRKHPVPSAASLGAAELPEAQPRAAFRAISWRRGTKRPLRASFAAVRVRVADGPLMARAQHLPGGEAWLVCERRSTGERKYHLANHPADAPLEVLAALIKARWVGEQTHQQLKEELGLDHFEGRSWRGLHHHALLCQLAFAFLQHRRLRGKKRRPAREGRAAASADAARGAPAHRRGPARPPAPLPALPAALRPSPPALNAARWCHALVRHRSGDHVAEALIKAGLARDRLRSPLGKPRTRQAPHPPGLIDGPSTRRASSHGRSRSHGRRSARATHQVTLFASSETNREPAGSTAMPAGRPQTSWLATTNPVTKSS